MLKICQNLKDLRINSDPKEDKEAIEQTLINVVKSLLMDEFEIIHWVKFIGRFQFKADDYAIGVYFIGLATKLLLNPQKVKEPLEVYLS
jgi:hypothetical protein